MSVFVMSGGVRWDSSAIGGNRINSTLGGSAVRSVSLSKSAIWCIDDMYCFSGDDVEHRGESVLLIDR